MSEHQLPYRPRDADEPEEEEDEVDETGYKTVKDAVLFAIEVSTSMLTPCPQSESMKGDVSSPAAAALKCAYHLMQQRIISNPKDMIGILLYGTEASKFYGEEENRRGGLSYPHCYLLTDLDVPAAEDVKALKTLVENEDESGKLLIPARETVSMANVLFCANQIFTTKAPNFSSRRLFIVTDNDNPHANEKMMRSSAAVRAKDLYDLGVIIELFPISRADTEFDPKKFYDDIIYRTSPTDPEAPAYLPSSTTKTSSAGDGISLLQSLLSNINSKAVARRALFSNLPLEIGPGLKISVKGFIIFKRQEPARSSYIYLGSEKPQLVKGVTSQVADDTAHTVERWEIRKAYKFGGESVYFTPEEVSQLKNFGDPVIRIIGFKPLSMLPIWASMKQAYFIYPSEEDYVGSTRVFSALYQKMLKDQLMAITWFIARRNATPAIVALLPGAEKTDEDGRQTLPQGLWIVHLPFADDIRQNPPTTLIRAEDELVDRMREAMQKLQLPKGQYDPLRYPNPALQWHYRILQALALDEDLPEKPEDKTIPKYKSIHKRVGEDMVHWSEELAEEQSHRQAERIPQQTKLGKRPGSEDIDGPGKKVKTEGVLEDHEIQSHVNEGTLSKLTVAQLKGWLIKKGDYATGRKADLVEAVEKRFRS